MKFAIDRIRTGSEKEVSADSFYDQYIPQRLSRFFCPECGEPVYWRKKGGSHPNQFYHAVKTETSPECDKRVDGRSDLYIYERVGMPVFLSRVGNTFQLSIGFPAIGEDALHKASTAGIQIRISASGQSRTIKVNQTNFSHDATTLVPVNFVPTNEKNYDITIEGTYWYNRRWADYADGFGYSGAIFTFDESGGKKIKRGDSISPSKEYYVVTKRLYSPYSEIRHSFIGTMQLNGEKYEVYEMTINVSVKNENRYALIDRYFKSNYGVWLLEKAPEIVPLWPPIVEQDGMIPSIRKNAVYCAVSSSNSSPTVYSYTGNAANLLPVHSDSLNNNTIKLPVYSSETVVSVDRKYVGREVVLQNKTISRPNHRYSIAIMDQDGFELDLDNLKNSDFHSALKIKTNAKMDTIISTAHHIYSRIPLRGQFTELSARSGVNALFFAIEKNIIFASFFESPLVHTETAEDDLVCIIRKSLKGALIPVPQWIRVLLSRWSVLGYKKVVSLVERNISHGKAPIGLIKELSSWITK